MHLAWENKALDKLWFCFIIEKRTRDVLLVPMPQNWLLFLRDVSFKSPCFSIVQILQGQPDILKSWIPSLTWIFCTGTTQRSPFQHDICLFSTDLFLWLCSKGYYFLAVESLVGLARLHSVQQNCLRAACVAAVCTLCGSLMDVARAPLPLRTLQRRLLENSAGKDGHATRVVCPKWSGGPVCALHLG